MFQKTSSSLFPIYFGISPSGQNMEGLMDIPSQVTWSLSPCISASRPPSPVSLLYHTLSGLLPLPPTILLLVDYSNVTIFFLIPSFIHFLRLNHVWTHFSLFLTRSSRKYHPFTSYIFRHFSSTVRLLFIVNVFYDFSTRILQSLSKVRFTITKNAKTGVTSHVRYIAYNKQSTIKI